MDLEMDMEMVSSNVKTYCYFHKQIFLNQNYNSFLMLYAYGNLKKHNVLKRNIEWIFKDNYRIGISLKCLFLFQI